MALAAVAHGQGAPRPAAQDTAASHRAAPANTPSTMGAIVGIVVDSLRGGPLKGAQVSVEGLNTLAVTDSTGRFRVDSVPPGKYRIGIFHPLLDSLALSIASPPLSVAADSTIAVVFATPSAPTFIRLVCGPIQIDSMAGVGPSVIVGQVLDAETEAPVANTKVSVSWVEILASAKIGLHRIQRSRDTTTGPNGGFRFCHLPSRLDGVARAISATADSGAVSRPLAMDGRLVVTLVLHVPGTAQPASTSSGHGTAAADTSSAAQPGSVLTGRVMRSDTTAPFAGAQVMVLGSKPTAVTNDSGYFTLRGLPTGSRTLAVRALGWEPVTMPVDLTMRETRQITVPLAVKTAVLRAVIVTATLNAGLQRVGYDNRRHLGIGHFLGPDDIANRNAFEFVDLMAGMPGVNRRPGPNGEDYLVGTRGMGACVGYVVDGVSYQEMTRGDINSYVRPDDIGAVEVYQANESPAQYAYSPPSLGMQGMTRAGTAPHAGQLAPSGGSVGGTSCVKILIWTKGHLGL
jgi:Carboxypeptidase regulatory-like domain/TonB-dependent Receptor Plug Domain